VALEDDVGGGRRHGGLEQVAIAVPEALDPDARDEVELDGPVGQGHPRAVADTRAQQREHQRPAAHATHLADGALVGLGGEIRAGLELLAHGVHQRRRRLAHRRRIQQRTEELASSPTHP
jgi:hypothetical protein